MKNLFAFVAGWFFFSLISGASAAEKIRVAFVSPSPSHSAAWIGKEAGLFRKYGLDAEIVLLTGSPRLVQALIAGDVDFAFVGISAVMRARMRGADAVILGTSTNYPTMKLLVNPKAGIRRVEELKGRVVGVSQYGSEADIFARLAIATAGLKPDKDVAIIQMGGHPQAAAALIAHKIDAAVLGSLALVAATKGGAKVLTDAMSLKISSPSGTLATTRRFIRSRHEAVRQFMRVYVEAQHYFKSNPAGTLPILQKYMGGIAREEAELLYREYVDLMEELPVPSEKGLQGILEREADPKAREFKPGDFVDLSFLKEIDRGSLVERLYRK